MVSHEVAGALELPVTSRLGLGERRLNNRCGDLERVAINVVEQRALCAVGVGHCKEAVVDVDGYRDALSRAYPMDCTLDLATVWRCSAFCIFVISDV